MNCIPYKKAYPNLEQALRDGAKISISRSTEGLRIVRVEDEKNNLISYGEYPYLSGALAHAESDFGLSYEEQYSNENARHDHYTRGIPPQAHDVFDQYVYNQDNIALTIFHVQRWKKITCVRSHPERIFDDQIIWGSGPGLLQAMYDCFTNQHVENKELFMNRVSIEKID